MTDGRAARATVHTAHDDPETVAAALAPDNTPEIDTRVVEGRVVTVVERGDAGGLRSTVDDYLVNLDVAERTVGQLSGTDAPDAPNRRRDADTDSDDANRNTNADADTDSDPHT
jgi:hypothetical protein